MLLCQGRGRLAREASIRDTLSYLRTVGDEVEVSALLHAPPFLKLHVT